MNIFKRHLFLIITIALLGELYIYPFTNNTNFRFSAGVIALSLVLLLVEDISELKLSYHTGLSILILRTIIDIIITENTLFYIINSNLPSALYYVLFCFLAYLSGLRNAKNKPFYITIIILTIDVVCNLIETILLSSLTFALFKYIIGVSLARSIISTISYIFLRKQENIIKKKEHHLRYVQLNTLVSDIQSEMFYLKKSMNDIEHVMSKSYALYENNKDNINIKDDALEIARDIHEIKKDYYRVISGFDSFLKTFEDNTQMSFEDIFFIIESNAKRYIEKKSKDIELTFTTTNDIYISSYYSIFTILNNLLNNAIDSIHEIGTIKIIEKIESDNVIIKISDNGEGIDNDLIPYIFNPGFTTKYDKYTGNPSTGIGLSHVENIIMELKGEITVSSSPLGTEFTLILPIDKLRG